MMARARRKATGKQRVVAVLDESEGRLLDLGSPSVTPERACRLVVRSVLAAALRARQG